MEQLRPVAECVEVVGACDAEDANRNTTDSRTDDPREVELDRFKAMPCLSCSRLTRSPIRLARRVAQLN